MPTVEIDDLNIFYEDVGSGFPLVLLHPWPTDHAMWLFQVPEFSEKYRVITPDSRGLGKSAKPRNIERYSLKRLSDDIEALLDLLGIDKAFVVGNSLGGAVAEKFAIDHSDRVQATVWIGAPTFPLDDLTVEFPGKQILPVMQHYLKIIRNSGYVGFWEHVWKPTMSYQFHENFVKTYVGRDLIHYLFEDRYARMNSDITGMVAIIEGIHGEKSLDQDLAGLELPSAIVCGDGDDTLPACKQQHEAIPKADYFVIKDSGHFCYMDNPKIFNDYLRKFLKNHNR